MRGKWIALLADLTTKPLRVPPETATAPLSSDAGAPEGQPDAETED